MSGEISLDTNIVIRLLKNDPLVTKKLASSTNFFLPIPVIAELLFAPKNSSRIKENIVIYNEFIDFCNVLNITRETADHYSTIRLDLKKRGCPIPENDLWIASVCKEHAFPLATGDYHFDNVHGLKIIKL
ncbi:MAG: nucleic acid-binding protein contains PIN domain protein [Candidatus Scalindua rubra]|uniref:Nucleic acid-binding protein contains PIN domain protein n=1 Tax=Candidatus Scalindua rubra TaxID=1872076 RepID=A0A1E3X8L6_9BACT|nr:MAG: nucleic acid-binding protein contains PIN domain protein [Candidatus Scalindua rubra]